MAEYEQLEVEVRELDLANKGSEQEEARDDALNVLAPGDPEPETVDGFWDGIGKGMATFSKSVAAYLTTLTALRFKLWKDDNEERGRRFLDQVIEDGIRSEDIGPQMAEELREIEEALPWPIDWVLLYIVALQVKLLRFWEYVKGLANMAAQQSNVDLRPNLIGLDVIVRALHRIPSRQAELIDIIERWGIPTEQISDLIAANRPLPTLTEILTLVNRGGIEEGEGIALLQAQGFPEAHAEKLLELRRFYPGPSDLVSLAGREAFEPESIKRFKLDMDFDLIDPEIFAKAGVSKEIAKWYWVAHWQNPSLNQVFEMIHRKVQKPGANMQPGGGGAFSLDDLSVYYKLADINPFFGDLLRQIAFRVPTRVDTRRMFDMGVIDREKVRSLYEAQGYSPEDAELLTAFSEKLRDNDTRKLTRSQIVQMFQLGQLDRIQLAIWLKAIGYEDEEAEILADLEQAKKDEKRLRSITRRAEFDYKRQVKDGVQVAAFLAAEDVTSKQIADYLEEWDNEIPVEAAHPSKDDLLGWLGGAQIDEVRFRAGMEMLRYSTEDIDIYLEARGSTLSKTDLLRLYDRGQIEPIRVREGLVQLGYQLEDINALVEEVAQRKARRAEFEQTKGNDGKSSETPSAKITRGPTPSGPGFPD